MSDSAQREWRFYFDDMISFAEKVVAYTNGLDQATFVARSLNYDGTLRNLELIGEAANCLIGLAPTVQRSVSVECGLRLSAGHFFGPGYYRTKRRA